MTNTQYFVLLVILQICEINFKWTSGFISPSHGFQHIGDLFESSAC